ncbi:D-tyrosyl-tRNA(Tyr) deacylase 1 [Trichoplax sp. H2]|nr:D-tyrosyl-tRNA(Tyr) deacylase 1 [Trichoplax sp. H2]|eukprot:RDD38495.1 D-tyrosyl-tRNA(Tyr) deacylase 1 [Trichoplax sp. H2]
MKILIKRVTCASATAYSMCRSRKVLKLRLIENGQKRCVKNIVKKDLEILCISQITLHGALKTNVLDFRKSMSADSSKKLYQKSIYRLRSSYKPGAIKDGLFDAYTEYCVQNDGYVIYQLESPSKNS